MTIDLNQLKELFANVAANEEAPPSVRSFAAQNVVLTAHVEQVRDHIKALDQTVAELAQYFLKSRQGSDTQPTPQIPPQTPPVGGAKPPVIEDDADEDEATQKMIDDISRDSAAEIEQINTTVLPRKSKTNNQEAQS